MNNLEAELEELRPQLEVIVLSVKLIGSERSFTEALAIAHACFALDKDFERRLSHARTALRWWTR